ncbi:MAG: pyridoxal phosphate-dependent aminotransferase [Pseudomonadota bacterium]
MPGPRLTPLVEGLPPTVPFVGPETQERARGRAFAARLGANESVFGPSPAAIAAVLDAASGAWMYGDPENFDLKQALAAHLGVPPEAILVGEGIDGILGYTVRLMVTDGDHVVTSNGAYPTFNYHVAGFGGILHKVPYRDDEEDPEALIAKARTVDAKLVYLANPDNPMGSWHGAARVQAMIDAVPEGCVLVIDEAYSEFAPGGSLPTLDPTDRRVLRMRTFSKAYGLAGLRVGYAIGHPDTIRAFDRIRNHFGMSRVSQAGALAALSDRDWLADVQGKVARARVKITDVARNAGLRPLPSAANFVTIDCGGGSDLAKETLKALVERDIFVRMPFVAPQDRCIRISCGTDADIAAFAAALPAALAAARDASRS